MTRDVNDSSSESEFEDDPSTEEGEQISEPSENDSRTLNNVRGELIRKQERSAAQLQDQIGMLTESMQRMADAMADAAEKRVQAPIPAAHAQQPISQYTPNPSINQYTDEQLQVALSSGQLTAAQEREIGRVLSERTTDQKVARMFEIRDAESKKANAALEAKDAALASFPALRDPRSEFSRRYKAALDTQRANYGTFPTDEFDVANRLARQMGVEVSKLVTPGFIGKPGSVAPEKPVDEYAGPKEAEVREITDSLKYAMPLRRNPKTGRMERKEFNIKRIKERAKRYNEERVAGLRGQPKLRGGQ